MLPLECVLLPVEQSHSTIQSSEEMKKNRLFNHPKKI